MSGAQVRVDSREVLEVLRAFERKVSDLKPAFREFGEYLLLSHDERWAREESPDGTPWEPLSPAYRARKKKNADKILVLDGYLRDQLAYEVSDDGMAFGTNRIYGAAQQFGREDIGLPARPFLGLSDDDEQELLDIISDYLEPA